MKNQCEGWRRRGGALSFGPPTWSQCEKEGTVRLTVRQKGEPDKTLPACPECWKECIENKLNILKVEPL